MTPASQHFGTHSADTKQMDLNDSDESPVDLTGAEVYVEAGDHPVAGGRWYVPRPDLIPDDQPDLVSYQRQSGIFTFRSMITAQDLRTKSTWRRVDGGAV
jgi:hypothetical protein